MKTNSVEEICRYVHELLDTLPVYTKPNQVPFTNGLYFFYEKGEVSIHAPNGRIVRLGNHPYSSNGLIRRLQLHYSGNKNSSVFRKFLGGALMRRANPDHPCLLHWEKQGEPTCQLCKGVEKDVSNLLRSNFYFRCVKIEDMVLRNSLERKLIATISLCKICKPSNSWLGRYAYSDVVRSSGLWNTDYVYDRSLIMGAKDLDKLRNLIHSISVLE